MRREARVSTFIDILAERRVRERPCRAATSNGAEPPSDRNGGSVSGWIVWYVTAYDPGAAVVVVATVDDSMSFPVHGFPFAGYGTNLPSFTWTNHPQFVGAALPKVAALMSIGWHDRPAPS